MKEEAHGESLSSWGPERSLHCTWEEEKKAILTKLQYPFQIRHLEVVQVLRGLPRAQTVGFVMP